MKRRAWIVLMVMMILSLSFAGIGCKKKAPPPPSKPDLSVVQPAAPVKDDAARDAETLRKQEIQKARARFVNEHIHFDFDKSDITSQAQAILQVKSEWLRNNSSVSIIIEGHCDERGTNEYNLALGDRRARAAKAFLVDLGVSPGRMDTISYGEEMPLDPGHNEAAWAKNRRAQFVIK